MSYDALTTEDLNRFRMMKEHAAEEAPDRGTDDMSGFVEVYRDGKPLLAIFCPDVDRDQVLEAAWFAVPAVNADRALVIMDAHLSRDLNNPATGKPWGPGEMQKACHDDGMCSTGAITDCLIINDVRRDGTYHMHSLTYHIDEAAKAAGNQPVAVHWQDQGDELHHIGEGDAKLQGLVPETLQAAFEREVNEDELDTASAELGITKEHAMAARDAAAVARLAMKGYGVGITGDDPEYFGLVKGLLDQFESIMGGLTTQEINNAPSNN